MKLNILSLVIVWSLVIGHWSSVFAIRPLYTEDCWVTKQGKPVIETGVLLLTKRDDTAYKEIVTALKYGLSENVDVGLDLPYGSAGSYSENYDGLSNGTFRVKYKFYDNGGNEGASWLLGYMVDTGNPEDNRLELYHHDISTMLIYSKDLGEFNFHLNFCYTFDDEAVREDARDVIFYNASIIKPLNELVNIMTETQYSKDTNTGAIVHEVAAGFNYAYSKNLIFDMALGCGLTEDSSSSNLAFGATFLFE